MQTTVPGPESIIAAPRRQDGWRRCEDPGSHTALLASAGPFDAMAAERLGREVRALLLIGCRYFIFDLRQCESVIPQGAQGLLSLRFDLSRRGGRVQLLLAGGSRVERMLRLLRFGDLFPIVRAAGASRRA